MKSIVISLLNTDKPLRLADQFCEMTSHQQAQFFDEVARLSSEWKDSGGMEVQMWAMAPYLTIQAKLVISIIYNSTKTQNDVDTKIN